MIVFWRYLCPILGVVGVVCVDRLLAIARQDRRHVKFCRGQSDVVKSLVIRCVDNNCPLIDRPILQNIQPGAYQTQCL